MASIFSEKLVGTIVFTFIFQQTTNGSVVYLIAGISWLVIMIVGMPYLLRIIKLDFKLREEN